MELFYSTVNLDIKQRRLLCELDNILKEIQSRVRNDLGDQLMSSSLLQIKPLKNQIMSTKLNIYHKQWFGTFYEKHIAM